MLFFWVILRKEMNCVAEFHIHDRHTVFVLQMLWKGTWNNAFLSFNSCLEQLPYGSHCHFALNILTGRNEFAKDERKMLCLEVLLTTKHSITCFMKVQKSSTNLQIELILLLRTLGIIAHASSQAWPPILNKPLKRANLKVESKRKRKCSMWPHWEEG